MFKNRTFNIVDDLKYKTLEFRHVPDTSGYQIFLDNQVRYFNTIFSTDDLKEKLLYFQKTFKLEETTPPEVNKDTGKPKRKRRTKAEMLEFRRIQAETKIKKKRKRKSKKRKAA